MIVQKLSDCVQHSAFTVNIQCSTLFCKNNFYAFVHTSFSLPNFWILNANGNKSHQSYASFTKLNVRYSIFNAQIDTMYSVTNLLPWQQHVCIDCCNDWLCFRIWFGYVFFSLPRNFYPNWHLSGWFVIYDWFEFKVLHQYSVEKRILNDADPMRLNSTTMDYNFGHLNENVLIEIWDKHRFQTKSLTIILNEYL